MNPRLIDVSLPLKTISRESTIEKARHIGHISSLHMWFARRPLTASRATAYASLVKSPGSETDIRQVRKTLEDLSRHANADSMALIRQARKDILASNNGNPPKVLDPFGGGGAIPLECIRLGCETYSNDYNPVAYIVQKCTLQYPLEYGKVSEETDPESSKLIRDIKKWSGWVESEAKKDIGSHFLDRDSEYLWARTIPCQNPACGAAIPVINSYILSRRDAVYMCPVVGGKNITFRVVGGTYDEIPENFDKSAGTIKRSYVTCPCCKNTIKPQDTNRLLQNNPDDEQMIIVVERPPRGKKRYRPVTSQDIQIYDACRSDLEKSRKRFIERYDIDPIPTELMGTPDGSEYRTGQPYWIFNQLIRSGPVRWDQIYNIRQKLVMTTLLHKIRESEPMILAETGDKRYTKCIVSYLGIILDKLAAAYSKTSYWEPLGCRTVTILTGSSIRRVVWYSELNPFGKAGIQQRTKIVCRGVAQPIRTCGNPAKNITYGSATRLKYPDAHFDAVFTDPPYYDFVPYSDFSDYFYVWLKRSIGHLYPDMFKTALAVKRQELVVNANSVAGLRGTNVAKEDLNLKTKSYYEQGMAEAVSEMYRVLKPDGILTMVYTHSSLDGWETLIKAIKKSGFVITAAWPLSTETAYRMTAQGKASVQSSIYMVAQKWRRDDVGFYTDIKKAMFADLKKKLPAFADSINRNDYFIAAIGFALKWFTRYDAVIEDSGNKVTTYRMLEDIRQFTIQYKMQEILKDDVIFDSRITRLYLLYRWMYGDARVRYDVARKLLQGCGVDIRQHKGLIQKKGGMVQVLTPSEREDVDRIPEDNLINILHKAVLLRDSDRTADYKMLLERHNHANNELLYKVAKAIVSVQENSTTETRRLAAFVKGVDLESAPSSGIYGVK